MPTDESRTNHTVCHRAIAESQRFRQAIQQGIDAGFQLESLHEQDPKRLASSFEQEN